jgi:hypothetical protein
MGWHYILSFRAKILPEFIPFVKKEWLMHTVPYGDSDAEFADEDLEKEVELLTKTEKDLIEIWKCLGIGRRFYKYSLEGDILECEISKKVTHHRGELRDDYESFLNDIIVPISSEIYNCRIESDDMGCGVWHYSDSELRNIGFHLPDKIKSIEHEYSNDGSEIYATRITYKHSIKKLQFLDLNRSYGGKN